MKSASTKTWFASTKPSVTATAYLTAKRPAARRAKEKEKEKEKERAGGEGGITAGVGAVGKGAVTTKGGRARCRVRGGEVGE